MGHVRSAALFSFTLPMLLPMPLATPRGPAPPADSTQAVGRSAHVSVRAHQRVYTLAAHPDRCGVLLTLTNLTARRIGVDLRSYWEAIYPSQWVLSRGPQRDLIEETVRPLSTLTAADSQALNRAFQAGQLTMLAPHGSMAVFTLFNGRCPPLRTAPDVRYLILPMVGALRSADGMTVAELRLTEEAPRVRDLVLRLPAVRRSLPPGVRRLLPGGTE
jgi:hypothetical protein